MSNIETNVAGTFYLYSQFNHFRPSERLPVVPGNYSLFCVIYFFNYYLHMNFFLLTNLIDVVHLGWLIIVLRHQVCEALDEKFESRTKTFEVPCRYL